MQRCYYLDLAKVITAFLVIFGHLYTSGSKVCLYLYAFHMPLFFIVSGVFHKYEGKINWIHYCKTILWPVLIFTGLSILTYHLFLGASFSYLWQHFFVELLTGKYHDIFWFLFALFWCKVILDCICRFHSFLYLFIVVWAGLLFIPAFIFKTRLPFALSQGLMAIPFYMTGFLGKNYFLHRTPSFKWGILCVSCLFLTVLITLIQGRVSMLGVKFGSVGSSVLGERFETAPVAIRGLLQTVSVVLFYLNGFIGSSMILSFSLLPLPKIGIVTSLSKSLITVVGTQYLFINPITRILGYGNSYLLGAGISLCIFAFCFLMHLLLRPVYKIVR